MKINLDVSKLTLREVEDFEEATGLPISSLKPGSVTAKQMRGIIWLTQRRADPDFTYEQAGDLILGELEWDAPLETGAAASPNGSPRSATSTAAASRRKLSGV